MVRILVEMEFSQIQYYSEFIVHRLPPTYYNKNYLRRYQ